MKKKISLIIPCYNESSNIQSLYNRLLAVTKQNSQYVYELIYINDGSKDTTLSELKHIAAKNSSVKLINLSRNFGKEIATTAGIHYADGDALIMLDGDGQHPPELISELLEKWREGAQIVIGVRKDNQGEGWIKKYGSKCFYKLFNSITDTKLVPGSTDFRLIDKVVQSEFVRMTERNRLTRGLIDWLGFHHEYVYFSASARQGGTAGYSIRKLLKLALNSFISLSLKPLYFSVYAGLLILPFSILLILFSAIETAIGDPLGLNITGSAYLGILILFLVGILLVSQGITALYLTHIHTEAQNRPLFVIDKTNSYGISYTAQDDI